LKLPKFVWSLLLLLSVIACNNKDDNEIEIINNDPKPYTLIIGHKATGSGTNNLGLVENTFEAVQYGYKHLDGIEVDLQMSKDTTLWLIHHTYMTDCNGNSAKMFSIADTTLKQISNCTNGTLITLNQLFEYLSKQKTKKLVSLDMKVIGNLGCTIPNKNEVVANILDTLYNQYKPNATIAIESFDIDFLEMVEQKTPEIETYILVWYRTKENEVWFAKNHGIDGISCRYLPEITQSTTNKAIELGIKIQMWTLCKDDDIQKAAELHPYALQVDSISSYLYK